MCSTLAPSNTSTSPLSPTSASAFKHKLARHHRFYAFLQVLRKWRGSFAFLHAGYGYAILILTLNSCYGAQICRPVDRSEVFCALMGSLNAFDWLFQVAALSSGKSLVKHAVERKLFKERHSLWLTEATMTSWRGRRRDGTMATGLLCEYKGFVLSSAVRNCDGWLYSRTSSLFTIF